jgi:hypothetical protein
MHRRDVLRTALGFAALAPLAGCMTGSLMQDAAFETDASPWPDIFRRLPHALRNVIEQPDHEVQLIYTRIDRDADGAATLTQSAHGLAPHSWFAAASMIKLPIALLACEALAAAGGDSAARIVLAALPETGEWSDDEPLVETFERCLRRLFVVSDNIAYNRLYEWLGQDAVHARLAELGWPSVRAIARIGSTDVQANRRVGAVSLMSADGRTLQSLPARRSAHERRFPFGDALRGGGFVVDGKVVHGPHDFSHANYLPLADAHDMLQRLLFPDSVPVNLRWRIPDALRMELLRAMSLYPRESPDPRYDEVEFPDGYAKMFVVGDGKARAPAGLRMYGKSAQAYGYMGDCVYLADRARGTECLLSASVYANADGIFNDDIYEYDTISIPFLAVLGRAVLDYEASRVRSHPARFDGLPL